MQHIILSWKFLVKKTSENLSDIDFKNLMKIFQEYNEEPYSFLVNDTTLSSDNPLWFRKNLLNEC